MDRRITHGCFGAGGILVFDGTRIVETGPAGEVAVWGTVIAQDPPGTVTLTWHPGRSADAATQVTLTFTPTGQSGATLVTLEHDGWESYPDPDLARGEYADGWLTVLDHYADGSPASGADGETGPEAEDGTELWLILEHRPGPAVPAEGVFASPDFGNHLGFLAASGNRAS